MSKGGGAACMRLISMEIIHLPLIPSKDEMVEWLLRSAKVIGWEKDKNAKMTVYVLSSLPSGS